MDTSIAVALITSCTDIIIAFIGAWASTTKAVATAVGPLNAKIAEQGDEITRQGLLIARMRDKIEKLGGDPYDL